MNEHRLIEQALDCLEEAAGRLEDGEEIDPDFFIDAAAFVAGFADGSHHRKEEDILFVAMTEKDMPADTGPVAVMLHEHEEGRRFTAGFRSGAEQMKTLFLSFKPFMLIFPFSEEIYTSQSLSPIVTEYGFLPGFHLSSWRLSLSSESRSSLSVFAPIGAAPAFGKSPVATIPTAPWAPSLPSALVLDALSPIDILAKA
jgi:hypothetical protein